MPSEEKELIKEWVAGGMPFGNIRDLSSNRDIATANARSGWEKDWQLSRQPDLVVAMADLPFKVPADETVDYQYYVVDPGFKKDTWITGAQVRPGNRAVVHHCIVFIRPPDSASFRGIGWLGGYVPGQRAANYPVGYARRIPAGSKLVFQMHYTPTGTVEDDLTEVGLLIGNEHDITHEIVTLTAINSEFEIPPFSEDHSVTAAVRWLPKRGALMAVTPHMHLRGKSFRVFAERVPPAVTAEVEQEQTLLYVPNYDFNWQHVYAFRDPLPLDSVSRLWIEARFDNSAANPANPDPSSAIYWGDQTDEEMAIGFFEVALDRQSAKELRARAVTEKKKTGKTLSSERAEMAKRFARRFIERWDANGDGKLIGEEVPNAIRHFGFRELDRNHNGSIEEREIEQLRLRRFQTRQDR